MFFFLSKILDVLLGPYFWGLVLVACALPWRGPDTPSWRTRRALGGGALLLLCIASMEPVANWLQWRLEHGVKPTYRPDVTYDVVVLLGGMTDGRVGADTGQPAYSEGVDRAIQTYDLLKRNQARFAILSAAPAEDLADPAFAEVRVLSRLLADWGIDPARLIIEDRARNTRENALYSKEIIDARHFNNVLVVTSAFHVPRAVECFHAVGLGVDSFATDYRARRVTLSTLGGLAPRPQWLGMTTGALREILGRYVYRLQGYGRASPDPRSTLQTR